MGSKPRQLFESELRPPPIRLSVNYSVCFSVFFPVPLTPKVQLCRLMTTTQRKQDDRMCLCVGMAGEGPELFHFTRRKKRLVFSSPTPSLSFLMFDGHIRNKHNLVTQRGLLQFMHPAQLEEPDSDSSRFRVILHLNSWR